MRKEKDVRMKDEVKANTASLSSFIPHPFTSGRE
jgi:hypothetical protein